MRSGFGIAILASVLVCGGMVYLLMPAADNRIAGGESLVMYCAAGISKPVQQILEEYEQQYGVTIQVQYAGSGQLLSSIKTGGGDVYLAAAKSYLVDARQQKLVREIIPLARQHPILAVHKGNPKQIRTIDDLLQGDVRSVQADADRTAVGRVAQKLLTPDVWKNLVQRAIVQRATVNEVANDIKTGVADAGIVWNATAGQYPDLEIVEVPQLALSPNQITVGILSSSKQPERALHFARFMSARDRGLLEFAKLGYQVVEGDKWAENPEITFFAGGLNRLAVESAVDRFAKREGASVITKYNGCGILVGEMKVGSHPDLYFSCDTSFMEKVQHLFHAPQDVSSTRMVIAVQKGNPRQIHTLRDLTQSDLQLGLCDPDKSALGSLSALLLDQLQISEAVRANQVYSSATAAELVSALVIGKIDAAIVYEANVVKQEHTLDSIRIEDDRALAIQPIAIGRESDQPQLSARLMEAILSVDNKAAFDAYGFNRLTDQ